MYTSLDPSELSPREIYRIMTSCMVPRPIAWVSTQDARGCANLAPFSFYTLVSTVPPLVALSISAVQEQDKDTAANILATKEFVINFVTVDLMDRMHASSATFPAGIDEAAALGIEMMPSQTVHPYSVADSPVHLECVLAETLEFGRYKTRLIVGEVVNFHLSDQCMADGKIDGTLLNPLGRLGGPWYAGLQPRMQASAADKPQAPKAT
ncbi:flavin reductase family protein [Pusillimonas sp. TS35]|nr:flavin reductase family protein [Pusillimonas sp. TS35]